MKDFLAPYGSLKREGLNGYVPARKMLTVEGCEVSNVQHHGSFDCDWSGDTVYASLADSMEEIKNRKGMSMLFHPTGSGYDTLYNQYPIDVLFGFEIVNQNDRYTNLRSVYDTTLASLMPNRPVWCYANDDMHTTDHLFRAYNIMLMEGLNVSELRRAWRNGTSYCSYEILGSGEAKAPHIEEIIFDDINKTITVVSNNASTYAWKSGGSGIIVGNSNVINYGNITISDSFIRLELQNEFGITYLNPFGFDASKNLVVNPYETVRWNEVNRYKGNFHTHTTESDGEIFGAEVIELYENANYDILIITDHDSRRPSQYIPKVNGGVPYINTWEWEIFEAPEPEPEPEKPTVKRSGLFPPIKP